MYQEEHVPQDLLAEFFRQVNFKGDVNGIFRVPPQLLRQLGRNIRPPKEGVAHKLNYRVALESNPLQRVLDASHNRLLRCGRVKSAFQENPLFVGLFTAPSFDARYVPTESGNLILVYAGALSVTLELLWSSLVFGLIDESAEPPDEVEDDVSDEDYVRTVLAQPRAARHPFEIFDEYLQNGTSPGRYGPGREFGASSVMFNAETGLIRPTHPLESMFVTLARPCIDFFVAHEYGHLIAGHGATSPGLEQMIEEECEADAIGLELLAEAWPDVLPLAFVGGSGETVAVFPPQMALLSLELLRLFRHMESTTPIQHAGTNEMFEARRPRAVSKLIELWRGDLGDIPAETTGWVHDAAQAYWDQLHNPS